MTTPREISDWGLIRELHENPEPLIVTIVNRLDRRHAPAARRMSELAADYDDASFRLIDVAENPSLRRILKLRRLPGVVVYTRGTEPRRWQGHVQKRWVAALLSAFLGRD